MRHHIENPPAGQFRGGGQGSSACPGLRCSRIGARGAIKFRQLCNLVQQRHELRHVAENRMRARCTERRGNTLAGSILLVGKSASYST